MKYYVEKSWQQDPYQLTDLKPGSFIWLAKSDLKKHTTNTFFEIEGGIYNPKCPWLVSRFMKMSDVRFLSIKLHFFSIKLFV